MSDPTKPRSGDRSSIRVHSAYDDESLVDLPRYAAGVPIQCQYCPCQSFRRSRIRMADVKQILLMRYPVRCLRCSQRQLVSFTIAGLAVPSHVKQRRARHATHLKHWSQPAPESLSPTTHPAATTDTPDQP
jgi:hypothetical protein